MNASERKSEIRLIVISLILMLGFIIGGWLGASALTARTMRAMAAQEAATPQPGADHTAAAEPTVDFLQPAGEPALITPDSVSWRIFKSPIALYIGGIAAVLLELASPLNLSGPKAKAIPIMTAQAAASGIQNPGVNALISGWGALSSGGTDPDILQKAIVPIVANEEAALSYAANPDYGPGYITAKMIAAGYLGVGNIDACQGDSGGPMVVSDNANAFGYRLAGVTSFAAHWFF